MARKPIKDWKDVLHEMHNKSKCSSCGDEINYVGVCEICFCKEKLKIKTK